ncbi:MAG: GAF domain-containing protein [Rhodosalinus sp.]
MRPHLRHAERVLEIASKSSAAARSRLFASWRRSFHHHGLDPAQQDGVRRITERELSDRRKATGEILSIATPRLDSLYRLVGSSGCGVLLTDAEGVVLDLRASDGDRAAFETWGLSPGADWSEAAEGTNGIGTCIAEARRVIIHRDQHFRARNTAMSCIDAPVFGAQGELIGALDVSSARADQTAPINGLIAAQVAQTAREIEVQCFRAAFRKARIIVADDDDTRSAMLLAVDGDDLVVGATRAARIALGLPLSGPVKPAPASDVFGREDGPRGFEKAERSAVNRALARAGGNVSEAARALGVGRATLYRRMKRLNLG